MVMVRPVAMTDHNDTWPSTSIIVTSREDSSRCRGYAEHGKVVSRDRLSVHELRFAVDRRPDTPRGVCGEDVGDLRASFRELLKRGV
jgi:hypothetical protein